MFDENGNPVKEAGPAKPVQVLGWSHVPQAGDELRVVGDEREARHIAQERESRQRAADLVTTRPASSLADLLVRAREGELQVLNLVIKADVQGTLEAIRGSLTKMPQDEVAVNVIHAGVGDISESDVNLAAASGAVIIGFNGKVDPAAKRVADQLKVDVRVYKVIYELLDDVQKALVGMLEPEMVEQVLGHAEIRQTFSSGKTTIAGCMVLDGVIRRGAQARLVRGGTVVHDGRIGTLKRFKDDAREVAAGLECGLTLEGHNDVAVGDVIEAYAIQARARG